MGTLAVDAYLAAEVVGAVGSCLEHGGQGVLRRMAGAARQGIEHASGEHQAEGQPLVTLRQGIEVAVEKLV